MSTMLVRRVPVKQLASMRLTAGRTFAMDPYERASKGVVRRDTEGASAGAYATKQSHEKLVQDQRIRGADAESGAVPSSTQRVFLVVTRLYPNFSSIPSYVPQGTMQRMHDRLRVLFIVFGIAIFFTIFLGVESKNAQRIERDRAAGVKV